MAVVSVACLMYNDYNTFVYDYIMDKYLERYLLK